MIGVDTNVLVRYIVEDDEDQSRRAAAFLETAVSPEDPGFVSVVVLAEFVWVLERSYRFTVGEIATGVQTILRAEALRVERQTEVVAALGELESRRGSFADALIGALALREGCSHVVSFDKGVTRLPGFRLL